MKASELAKLLDGRPMGDEMSKAEEALAKEHGLLVVFAYSDDTAELRGFVCDEVSCYEGGTLSVDTLGIRTPWDNDEPIDEEDAREFFKRESLPSISVEAIWHDDGGPQGCCWSYRTHAHTACRFIIMEDSEPWCEGVVIDCNHLIVAEETE